MNNFKEQYIQIKREYKKLYGGRETTKITIMPSFKPLEQKNSILVDKPLSDKSSTPLFKKNCFSRQIT